MNIAPFRFFVLCIILFVDAILGQSAFSQVNRAGKPFPNVNLSKNAMAAEVETAMGSRFAAVAEWYGKTPADMRKTLQQDKHLIADRQGRLHYACAAPAADLGQAANGTSSTWGGTGKTFPAPFPDAQTFQLHSKPGATKVIYLDFDGNTTSGTYWNSSYAGGADIVTPAYDIDGNPASFSPQEMANIQLIWQSISEDFAPFDVDVTTQDPGVEALRKTTAGDQAYGIRICIGGSSLDWFGSSAGGVAYLNSFDWNSDTPAFVFPAQLGGGNPKYVAEAASHEAGHTFGLHHDGIINGTQYYAGQGGWAPIMGAGYYVDITQWCKGEYANANNTEDQLAMISSYVPYRADSVGGTTANATALIGSSFTTNGLIESTGDADVYSFFTGAGNVSLSAKAASPQAGDLNLLFSLYDSNGTLITTSGPSARDTGVSINTSLSSGTYYLAVNGVGSGDPLTTGFTNYGSIGQFTISGNTVPANNQAPTAVASNSAPLTGFAPLAVNFSSAGSSDPDGTITSYSWNFGDGTTSTAANPSKTYSNVGTYTATLIVSDNNGMASAPASVVITVQQAPPNQAPTAVASNSAPLTGFAPLAVNFSSAGSSDPDGTITSYSWNFGDGTTSTAANPSKTYSNAGTYTATLVVTDNQGLASAPASVTVTVKPPSVYVAGLTITKTGSSSKGYYATATITVKDQSGAVKGNVVVAGTWSGLTNSTTSVKTSTKGIATTKSTTTKNAGTFTYTVNNLTLSGFTYDPSLNVLSSVSITSP